MTRLLDLSVTLSDMFWKEELLGEMLKFSGRPLPTIFKFRFSEDVCGFCWRSELENSCISWLELSFWFVMDEFGCKGS